jgi:cell division protein FtsI/penicillin-binding protein 2
MIRRVLDKKAASRVRKILRDVVEKGLNDKASPRGVPVAGKTGTATKYDSSRNQYDRSRVVGTFIGFFPADDPQYVIGIMVDEPSKGGYASQFAVPVFKKAAEQVARYGGL